MCAKSEFLKEAAVFTGGFLMISAAALASIWAVKQSPRLVHGSVSFGDVPSPSKLAIRRGSGSRRVVGAASVTPRDDIAVSRHHRKVAHESDRS